MKQKIRNSPTIMKLLKDEVLGENFLSRTSAGLALLKLEEPLDHPIQRNITIPERELSLKTHLYRIREFLHFMDPGFKRKELAKLKEFSQDSYVYNLALVVELEIDTFPHQNVRKMHVLQDILKTSNVAKQDADVYYHLARVQLLLDNFSGCIKSMSDGLAVFPRYPRFKQLMIDFLENPKIKYTTDTGILVETLIRLDCWGVFDLVTNQIKK